MNQVYLIKRVDENKFKVGVTKNTKQRLQTLQTANAEKLELITTYPSSKWAYRIETAFKNQYKLKRMNGEWFELDDNDINEFKNFCYRQESTFDFLYESNVIFKNMIDSGR